MSKIAAVNVRKILDSRGNPTIEVDVRLTGECARTRSREPGAPIREYDGPRSGALTRGTGPVINEGLFRRRS